MIDTTEKNYYAYFFTRQDIFPEYQLVQTAHAALKMGYRAASNWGKNAEDTLHFYQIKDFNPDKTYFTCIGVRDTQALYAVVDILTEFGFKFEVFYEPDINKITSIAVYPIHEDHKGILAAFNLLRFGSRV